MWVNVSEWLGQGQSASTEAVTLDSGTDGVATRPQSFTAIALQGTCLFCSGGQANDQYLTSHYDDELTRSASAVSEADRLVKDHWKLENQALESGLCAQWIASRSRMCQSASDSRRLHSSTDSPAHASHQIGQCSLDFKSWECGTVCFLVNAQQRSRLWPHVLRGRKTNLNKLVSMHSIHPV